MMLRVLLSLALALFVGLSTVSAQDAAKKECPKKPAAEKKEKVKKPPLTDAQKAELAKKRAAAAEKAFKAKDKDGNGKLTLEELKGKSKKPEAAEKAAKLLKAKDKDADGALTFEELTAKPAKPAKPAKKERKKPAK